MRLPGLDAFRQARSVHNPDGSATIHVFIECTLEELAKATFIRAEDISFALSECGLVRYRRDESSESGGMRQVFMISRDMVEEVAAQRKVRPNVIESKFLVKRPEQRIFDL